LQGAPVGVAERPCRRGGSTPQRRDRRVVRAGDPERLRESNLVLEGVGIVRAEGPPAVLDENGRRGQRGVGAVETDERVDELAAQPEPESVAVLPVEQGERAP